MFISSYYLLFAAVSPAFSDGACQLLQAEPAWVHDDAAIGTTSAVDRNSCLMSLSLLVSLLQVTLCVNIVYLLVLSTTTLPLYSLVVQMGGDFKGSLLPPDVRARLEAAAQEVRLTVVSLNQCAGRRWRCVRSGVQGLCIAQAPSHDDSRVHGCMMMPPRRGSWSGRRTRPGSARSSPTCCRP